MPEEDAEPDPDAVLEAVIQTDDPASIDPTFDAPWQARAFGLAVTLCREGPSEWSTFQGFLVDEIHATESGDPTVETVAGAEGSVDRPEEKADLIESLYYEQWLRALERLLVEDGPLDRSSLEGRIREFAAGERDASEFVEGEHGHEHHHEHDHSQ